MSCVGRCAIYANRPQFCRDYPQPGAVLPDGCTYYFLGTERHGSCDPSSCLEEMCCNWPREGGEPTAKSMDPYVGGLPCKHLVWVEQEEEKTAADDELDYSVTELYDELLDDLEPDHVS